MATSPPTLYIRLRKRVQLAAGRPVTLGQVSQILVNSEWEESLRSLPLLYPKRSDGNLHLIDMMLIVKKVKELLPELVIEQYGEPHVLVEFITRRRKPNLLLISLVWVLLFIGSGLAIMNFHADVSMLAVQRKIYEMFTGEYIPNPLLLQIPYSLGIGIGMVIFFNHLFKKKFNEEPSPLEVEMFTYQESLNQYVITEEYNRIHGGKNNRDD